MLLQFILQHGPLLKGGPLCSFDLNWAPFACYAGLIFEAAMSAHERHRSQVRFYPPAALIMGINMLTPLCLCGSWMCFGIGFDPPTCPLGRRQLGGTTSAPRAHPSSVIARRVDDLWPPTRGPSLRGLQHSHILIVCVPFSKTRYMLPWNQCRSNFD